LLEGYELSIMLGLVSNLEIIQELVTQLVIALDLNK